MRIIPGPAAMSLYDLGPGDVAWTSLKRVGRLG